MGWKVVRGQVSRQETGAPKRHKGDASQSRELHFVHADAARRKISGGDFVQPTAFTRRSALWSARGNEAFDHTAAYFLTVAEVAASSISLAVSFG